jgi:hypothetical protein
MTEIFFAVRVRGGVEGHMILYNIRDNNNQLVSYAYKLLLHMYQLRLYFWFEGMVWLRCVFSGKMRSWGGFEIVGWKNSIRGSGLAGGLMGGNSQWDGVVKGGGAI